MTACWRRRRRKRPVMCDDEIGTMLRSSRLDRAQMDAHYKLIYRRHY